ncbi:hypothetical protein DSO57_1016621 [Entomophthora muscae]|uniref:Uncharacterized protein n=1 Tax=Entomophthora muscae TaxID=34485 RepID=A0ACC2T4R4_9FUNG|nr:hypothetical protein DSO57_1016621 [Entomophthora muscae]
MKKRSKETENFLVVQQDQAKTLNSNIDGLCNDIAKVNKATSDVQDGLDTYQCTNEKQLDVIWGYL